jgi:hypothetical protein
MVSSVKAAAYRAPKYSGYRITYDPNNISQKLFLSRVGTSMMHWHAKRCKQLDMKGTVSCSTDPIRAEETTAGMCFSTEHAVKYLVPCISFEPRLTTRDSQFKPAIEFQCYV